MASLVESTSDGVNDGPGRGILASISFFASLRNTSLFLIGSSSSSPSLKSKQQSLADNQKENSSWNVSRNGFKCSCPHSFQPESFTTLTTSEDLNHDDNDKVSSFGSNGSNGKVPNGGQVSDLRRRKKVKEDANQNGCDKSSFASFGNETAADKSSPLLLEQLEEPRLVTYNSLPDYLQFNPWIIGGYRKTNMSSGECIKSLFYFHNETINIFTHVVSFLLFAFIMPSRLPWNQGITRPVLAYCTILGSFSSWIGSSMYHLFMNHERGYQFYSILLKIDVIGIWITQAIGATTTIVASTLLYDTELQVAFGIAYTFLSLRALRDVLTANSVWTRILGFSYLFILRIVAFGLRIYAIPTGAASPLIHIVMQEGWALIGSVISATRIPERWFPGRFDYLLNSHNLMHLFVVFGALHMHAATSYDLLWIKDIDNGTLNSTGIL